VEEEAALFRKSSHMITVSRSMKNLIQQVHDFPDAGLHLVHNGLNPEPFLRAPASNAKLSKLSGLAAPDGQKVILYAGRLHPQKGILPFLESAAAVVDQYPNVRYLIAGESDSHTYGRRIDAVLARYKTLSKSVKFLGRVSREQVMMLLRIANLAVMPSVYEPFANVALEIMAAGVPAVATEQGGFSDLIQHGETGLLVRVHQTDGLPHEVDVAELTAAQVSLLTDEKLAQQIGQAGRHHVLTEFTVERMATSTLDVYRQALKGAPIPAAKSAPT